MTDYKPIQIAKATVRGVPDTVMRVSGFTGRLGWRAEGGWFHDHEVTDVRPLVVLDLEDPATFVDWLRNGDTIKSHVVDAIADQIEAQTRPAIEEPKGIGAVVEDRDGTKWVRADDDSGPWHGFGSAREPYWRNWRDINAVRVLSEGVQ